MNLGDDIKQARKRKKMTQKRLAELTGIAEITIRQYEAGLYSPKMEQLKKLSRALQIPIGELLTDEQQKFRKLDAANRGLVAILETHYDTINFDWCYADHDGEREYDGDFNVVLSKKGEDDLTLTKQEWEALFLHICGAIPAFLKLIETHKDYEPPYDVHDL